MISIQNLIFTAFATFSLYAKVVNGVGFKYIENSAYCNDNDFGFNLNSFTVNCNGGHCNGGETMTLDAEITADYAFPEIGQVSVKACKFWGTMCALESSKELDACDYFGVESAYGDECPSAGTYTLEKTLKVPTFSFVSGFSFIIYFVYSYDGASVTCQGEFKTSNASSEYNVSASMAGFALLGMAAYGIRRKRQIKTAAEQENDEDSSAPSFEMMRDSVRV